MARAGTLGGDGGRTLTGVRTDRNGRLPVPPQLTPAYLREKVRESLAEDLGPDDLDLTTQAVIEGELEAEAELVAKAPGVLAGVLVAAEVFRQVDASVDFEALAEDGAQLAPGSRIARTRGSLRSLLRAERTALNFLQQLSGVATLTRSYVEAAAPGGRTILLDTRKTIPGLRPLQRHAVLAGGGSNHRYNLADAILIKDNHVAAAGGVGVAVERARTAGRTVEVEVDDLAQLDEALGARADAILLDNMSPSEVARAVAKVAGRVPLEVSGGVSLATVAAYAATGVDRISVGALTHSAAALDISMEVRRTWKR